MYHKPINIRNSFPRFKRQINSGCLIRLFLSFLIAYLPMNLEARPALKTFKIAPGLKVIHMLPSVYVIEDKDGPAAAYSMVVELSPDNLLIVDSPYTARNSKMVLQWIYKQFGKKKMTAINTHHHLDRIGGNEVWVGEKIPVWGSDLTASLLSNPQAHNNKWKVKQDMAQYVSDPSLKNAFTEMNITPPDHLFPIKHGKTLNIDGKKIEIFYPGRGHTPDNVVVYIPHLKLLFGGCMIVAFPKIYIVDDADITAWPKSVARLKRFKVEWVIPGHPASLDDDVNFDPELIHHTETLLKNKAFTRLTKK